MTYRHVENTSWPISTTARFGEPGVKRCHTGRYRHECFMRPFALTHTRLGSHTHVRGRVCRDGNPANARLNHCHLADWPVSVVLVKKKSRWLVASRLFRAWMNVHLYFTAEIAESRNERCARERKFHSSLREFEEIISFHREYAD